jgi:hypothetical protein
MGQSNYTFDGSPSGSSTGASTAPAGVSGGSRGFNGDAAAGLGVVGTGLKAYSDYEKGLGEKVGDDYKADMLNRSATYGELKATQTAGQMTRNLAITLGNIDAVHAAAHTDPTSPTGAAVRDYASSVGTEEESTKVSGILSQVQEDEANAAYLRSAGSQALLSGELNAGVDVATGLGQAIKAGA